MKKLLAEFLGTFVLVLFGCGAAVLAGAHIGFAGIALAFGLAVFVMAYAVGNISGGHFNPAVSVGLACAGRFGWRDLPMYVVAQLVGAAAAAGVLYTIATGTVGGGVDVGGFAANIIQGDYTLAAALTTEIVLTFVFLIVIIGATAREAFQKFAGAAIGLALVAIHLVSIPVTNTSVNPARSVSQALFATDPAAMCQLWIFIVAPIAGAIIAGLTWRYLMEVKAKPKAKK
ncbi:MAG: aquaporin Z [Alphaproteobacteria bacterium]|nr:aquaporin Z [Alphaproteobacteria bacterium]MCL2890256.1 aquaporin Z [Alphaproteobacteria bacterium]